MTISELFSSLYCLFIHEHINHFKINQNQKIIIYEQLKNNSKYCVYLEIINPNQTCLFMCLTGMDYFAQFNINVI